MKIILSKTHKKAIRKVTIVVILLFLAYFIFTIININRYLNEYGYSNKELPKTLAVYFHLSKGFTVEQKEDNKFIFIGRHDDIYNDVLREKGYFVERLGASSIYTKNENNEKSSIYILDTSDWCHWFRVYEIEGTRIEDFI